MPGPIPIAYTFGNHMHWVDMEWLWGYHVLPGSTQDMLRFCRETGAKGCLNFDGIGYEKMAAEAPEALAALRDAVQAGTIEPVGCSYGQPYGLFHGGESNIRQRVYGVRAVMRLLGTRPRTFWEEEFDFFPQLPQLLRGVGFTGASLYFQWTWHTPEVPFEASPVVWWEGMDGSRILTATRNRLNLHQWPEDFQLLLDELAEVGPEEVLGKDASPRRTNMEGGRLGEAPLPLILQWLELMPSSDWMCRSELMAPKLQEFLSDERFEVRFATLGEYLGSCACPEAPVRHYTLDDVWHGLTLGKNGNHLRRDSKKTECMLLAAESLNAVASVFGRPYANWDVYPVWELEEAWRELLSAQHHDNDECEGLCGHVGKASYARAFKLARHQWFRARELFSSRVAAPEGATTAVNSNGWICGGDSPVPGFGFVAHLPTKVSTKVEPSFELESDPDILGFRSTTGSLRIHPIPICRDGGYQAYREFAPPLSGAFEPAPPNPRARPGQGDGIEFDFHWAPSTRGKGVNVSIQADMQRLEPGFQGSLRVRFEFDEPFKVWADHPYGCSQVVTGQSGRRKYPKGDWMTSEQWFEEVEGAFTSLSHVRVELANETWLISHIGTRQWFLSKHALDCVVNAYDPWDEDFDESRVHYGWHLYRSDHRLLESECQRISRELEQGVVGARSYPERKRHVGDIHLTDFAFLDCEPPNVLITALYREAEDYAGRDLEQYAGRGMGYPYVLRLVEFDGLESEVDLTIAGPVANAFKTNLLGEPEEALTPVRGDDKILTSTPEHLRPFGIEAARLRFKMRPYEIATLYLDIVPGRKQFRDLDAKREVWATVHR